MFLIHFVAPTTKDQHPTLSDFLVKKVLLSYIQLSQGVLRRRWEVGDGRKRGGNEERRPNKEAEKSAASTCVLRPRYTLCSYFRMSEGKGSVQKWTDMNGGGL